MTDWVCGGNITLLRKSLNTICIRSKLSHETQYFIFGRTWSFHTFESSSIDEKMFNNQNMAQIKNIARGNGREYYFFVLSVRKVETKMTFSSVKSQFNPISKLVKCCSHQSSPDMNKVQQLWVLAQSIWWELRRIPAACQVEIQWMLMWILYSEYSCWLMRFSHGSFKQTV